MSVFDPEGEDPPFAYTVGLEFLYEHPELLVYGLPPDLSGALLNGLAGAVQEGRRFGPGEICSTDEFGLGFDVKFGTVLEHHREDIMLTACWFHGGSGFRALQLLWPDENGRFPDHPLFQKEFVLEQPLLHS